MAERRRRCGWACVVAAGLTVGVGCSDSPRAIVTAKSANQVVQSKAAAMVNQPAPEQSDPAAVAVVAEAVRSHTGGNPGLVEKLKTFRSERMVTYLDAAAQFEWRTQAVWPGRLRVDTNPAGAGKDSPARTTFTLNGDRGWVQLFTPQGTSDVRGGLDDPRLKGTVADGTHEWLLLLVPLTDPALIVSTADGDTVRDRPTVGVRVAGKGLPNAVVQFDKETKKLARFVYAGNEEGQSVTKEVTIYSTKLVNGVDLPDKVGVKWQGRPTIEWSLTKIEFPAEADRKAFELP